MQYLVTWEIDIEAGSPEEAAWKALEHRDRKGTSAKVFKVIGKGPYTKTFKIDLWGKRKPRVKNI